MNFTKKFEKECWKWFGDNPVIGHFFNTFSLIIPRGEQFFMQAVSFYANKLPEYHPTKEEVKTFMIQEGAHSALHQRLNKVIGEKYPFTKAFDEKYVSMLPFWVNRSMKHMLSCTLCLEFLTYIFARLILGRNLLKDAHPSVREFWCWHAVEEIEHKSMVHNLYKIINLSYIRRCLTMIWILIPLLYLLWWGMRRFAEHQGLSRKETWRGAIRFFFLEEKFILFFTLDLIIFFSPNFHPDYRDDSDVLPNDSSVTNTGKTIEGDFDISA